MSAFDALRHLSTYLYDAHVSGKHHLADLYELVQYCGNIVPRVRAEHRTALESRDGDRSHERSLTPPSSLPPLPLTAESCT